MLSPLYAVRPGDPMRVAGFMSGSGTNLVKILEAERSLSGGSGGSPFRVVAVFTDSPSSNAACIAEEHGIPLVQEDIQAFYRARGHDTKRDLSLRPVFDTLVREALAPHRPDAIVLAGYMSVVTKPLLEAFPGRIINVHPADLRILEGGRRRFTGDFAVRDAILAGEPAVRSTTHVVREQVDGGEILMVSDPVPVALPEGMRREDLGAPENRDLLRKIAGEHQDRLKRVGDWVILPKTLERLALGRYALDDEGRVYLDGEPVMDPSTAACSP